MVSYHWFGWFQSTPPLRGATHSSYSCTTIVQVSIHAPLAGCDLGLMVVFLSSICFNPRPPCGVRPAAISLPCSSVGFNPRPPCGVRLEKIAKIKGVTAFQSTPPLRGATESLRLTLFRSKFQSTPPLRGATGTGRGSRAKCKFQSTPPLRGATCLWYNLIPVFFVSIHAPLAGCDLFL